MQVFSQDAPRLKIPRDRTKVIGFDLADDVELEAVLDADGLTVGLLLTRTDGRLRRDEVVFRRPWAPNRPFPGADASVTLEHYDRDVGFHLTIDEWQDSASGSYSTIGRLLDL